MESPAHLELKRLSLRLLRHWGCVAMATEVRCPISRYRVDVAGYADREPPEDVGLANGSKSKRWRSAPPRTVLIECKQSRADFLRDRDDHDQLLALREKLHGIRRNIEEHHIKRHEPHLRNDGGTLFAELDDWNFSASKLSGYRKVIRQLRQIDRKLHGQTKFCLAARYGLADDLYLAAPQGMIRRGELPDGWGLLECPLEWLESPEEPSLFDPPRMLSVKIVAPPRRTPGRFRDRLLRNIAVAATWKALRDEPLGEGVW